MSDTVAVALITLSASLIGSIIGALSSCKVSLMGINAERSKAIRAEKKSAYSEFISAYTSAVEIAAKLESGEISANDDRVVSAMLRCFDATMLKLPS